MGKYGRGRPAYVPPVKNVDVQKPNIKKRLIIITIFFVIGIVGIGMGIYYSRQWEDGWKIVESDNVLGCASEISFHYYLAGDGARERSKEIARIYTDLCAREDLVYDRARSAMNAKSDESTDSAGKKDAGTAEANLADLNARPNEILTVCPELFRTLEKLNLAGNRYVFLGPIYETYDGIFSCTEDRETMDFDPLQNRELAEEFKRIAAYAKDPAMIDIELLGGNKVRLNVAEEYAAFAEERYLHNYIDLRILKNAAILEDMAAAFAEKGYTDGYMQTADGYSVNLKAGEDFLVNVANASDGIAAQLRVSPPVSFAACRDYALTDGDKWRVYTFADGSVRTVFLDPETGLPAASLHDLLLLSKEKSCLELAMLAVDVFGAKTFRAEKLPEKNLTAVWCEGKILRIRGERIRPDELAEGYVLKEE